MGVDQLDRVGIAAFSRALAPLGTLQQRMIDRLVDGPATVSEMIEAVWDVEAEPAFPEGQVRTVVRVLRRRGFPIHLYGPRGWGTLAHANRYQLGAF